MLMAETTGGRKVRCPKCTALLAEPKCPIFECPICSTILRAKGTPADFQGDLWQTQSQNDRGTQLTKVQESESATDSEASSVIRQNQIVDHGNKGSLTVDQNIVSHVENMVPESNEVVSLLTNDGDMEPQNLINGENGSTCDINLSEDSEGSTPMARDDNVEGMRESLVFFSEERVPISSLGSVQEEGSMPIHQSNQQRTLTTGNVSSTSRAPAADTQIGGVVRVFTEGNMLVGDSDGMTGRITKESDGIEESSHSGSVFSMNGNDRALQAEIVRDTDYELSFKHILERSSALESNDRPVERRRAHRPKKPFEEICAHNNSVSRRPLYAHLNVKTRVLCDGKSEQSDSSCSQSESVSHDSESESASHDGSESEFDFPAPVPEILQPIELSDSFLHNKIPSPDLHHGVSVGPHQLEFLSVNDDVNYYEETITVQTTMETGGDEEKVEMELNFQEENVPVLLSKVNDGEPEYTHLENSRVSNVIECGGEKSALIGYTRDKANVGVSFHSEEQEDFDKIQGSLCSQSSEREPMLSKESWKEGVEPLHGSSSRAGHPLMLSEPCSTEEGNVSANISSLDTEACKGLLSGSNEVATCLTGLENSSFIESAANAPCNDSKNVSIRDRSAMTETTESRMSSQMQVHDDITMAETSTQSGKAAIKGDGGHDHSHPHHNQMRLQATSGSGLAAKSRYLPIKGDDGQVHSVAGKEPESGVVVQDPFFNEQSILPGYRVHRERNGCVEAAQWHDHKGKLHDSFTSHEQRARPNEGVHGVGTRRYMKELSNARQRHADGQGPNVFFQNQNSQADLHTAGQPMDPYHANDFHHFSAAASRTFNSSNHHDPFGSLGYPPQVRSHCMLPGAMPGYSFSHCGCHPYTPVCMVCAHCQHSHVLQPSVPTCNFCLHHSLPMAPGHGQSESWHYHNPQLVQQPDQVQVKPQGSFARKLKHYPPLPQSSSAPYVLCKVCHEILQVPRDLPPSDGTIQKLCCGQCGNVSKFSVCTDVQRIRKVGLKATSNASTSMPAMLQCIKPSGQSIISSKIQSVSLYQQGSQSRGHEIDGSLNSFEFKASAAAVHTQSFDNDGWSYNSLPQSIVDEKDEGLDFGAPRISDGDSLGQRSPENLMRPTGNKQAIQQDRKVHARESDGNGEIHSAKRSWDEQAFGFKKQSDSSAQEKRSGLTLFALLNQESTKVSIKMEERVSFEDSKSALWSPASNSPMQDLVTNENCNPREEESRGFVWKGPRYIASLLSRSLGRGSQ